MAWYYMQDDNRIGPVDDAQFAHLVAQGVVSAETWVWRAGMADWKSYGEAMAEQPQQPAVSATASSSNASVFEEQAGGDASGAHPASRSSDGVSHASLQEASTAACVHCGKFLFTDEMIRYGASWVCAECKPAFFQKLKEGVMMPNELRYAGFWIRFVAVIVDGLLLQVVNGVIQVVAGIPTIFTPDKSSSPGLAIVVGILGFLIAVSYETWMVGQCGATLGKMALGLRVVKADGSPVSFLRSFGRFFAKLLSQMICFIGYIMAGFDEQKRGLHDRICETRVIRIR